MQDCQMMEAFIGSQQEIKVNINSALESLESVEINTEETKVKQWMMDGMTEYETKRKE